MELRQLECFARTAEIGNFTKAAELLHISQPALSNSIALLERSLGVQLFDRHGKKVSLNATGMSVYEQVQEILNRRDKIYSICQCAKQEENKLVSIRMMAASEFLTEILSAFKQQHPEITIRSYQNAGSMEQEDVDILVYASIRPHQYETNCSVLCEELAVAVPPEHPLYQQDSVTLAQITAYPLISLRTGNDMRRLEDHFFDLAGLNPRREVECDVPATLRSLIRKGFGIALVPTITWNLPGDSKLRLIPIRDYRCARYINVHLPHPERTNPSVELFFRYLKAYFEEKHPMDLNGNPNP